MGFYTNAGVRVLFVVGMCGEQTYEVGKLNNVGAGLHTRTSRQYPQGPQNWARVSRRELVRNRHRRRLLKKGCRKAEHDQQGRFQKENCVVLSSSGVHTGTSRPHRQGPQNWARVSRRDLVRRRHRPRLLKKRCRKANREPII
jgi:hypothetical protein